MRGSRDIFETGIHHQHQQISVWAFSEDWPFQVHSGLQEDVPAAPPWKSREDKKSCRYMMNKATTSFMDLVYLIGLLTPTLPAIQPAPLQYRALQNRALWRDQNYNRPCRCLLLSCPMLTYFSVSRPQPLPTSTGRWHTLTNRQTWPFKSGLGV